MIYEDDSEQSFSKSLGDWWGGSTYVVRLNGRVNRNNNSYDYCEDNPRFYQIELDGLDINKKVKQIDISNSGGSSSSKIANIFAVSGKFTIPPTCDAPSNVIASNVEASSVDISWTAASPAPSVGYEWEIIPTSGGTAVTSSTTNSSTTSASASGLIPNNTYKARVRANCGNDDFSTWVESSEFTTPCAPYTIPYFEGFENGYTHDSPVAGCLSQESVTGTYVWTANSEDTGYERTPRTGSFNATLRYSNTRWLFIPVQLSDNEVYRFEMYARQNSQTGAKITVAYGNESTAAAMTNIIINSQDIVSGDYQELSENFSVPTTAVYYVGVLGELTGNPWYLSIDDISIDLAPTCIEPENVNVAQNSLTTATATWQGSALIPANSYDWEVRTGGDAGSGSSGLVINGTAQATETSVNITGLEADINYTFYIRSNCGDGDFSSWVAKEFKLGYCIPEEPTNGCGGDHFSSVKIGTLDISGLSCDPFYADLSGSHTVPDFIAGTSLEITIGGESDFAKYIGVWVDYNQNGIFEESEFYGFGSVTNGTISHNINVPLNALNGNTKMRIRSEYYNAWNWTQACSKSSYGSTRDFTVNIVVGDMEFVSITAINSNTSSASIGAVNQEVLSVEVETIGVDNPLVLSRLDFRTTGTTDLEDISDIKLFYTGNSPEFTLAGLQLSSLSVPQENSTTISADFTRTLLPGKNYFWLTYSIKQDANEGNFIDASLRGYKFDGENAVSEIIDPIGNRILVKGCNHTITLKYDYGTGWYSGSKASVFVNDIEVLSNITHSSGSSTIHTFLAQTGDEIKVVYDGVDYDERNSYYITNPMGAYILSSGEHGTSPESKTGIAHCTKVIEFSTNEHAYQYSDSCFVITENKKSQAGSVWSNYRINMTQDFELSFTMHLGDKSQGLGGGDGMVFVLQGDCTSAGGLGAGMGYEDIENSIGVEFDTYQNWDTKRDPNTNHIALMFGGKTHHETNQLAIHTPANDMVGEWRDIVVNWNVSQQLFTLKYDNTTAISKNIPNIIDNHLGGSEFVFFGFTGATGENHNLQRVCISYLPNNTTMLGDTLIEIYTDVQVQVAQGAASYSWSPDNGSISNPSSYNPTLSPEVSTEYTCEIMDACENVIYNRFWVYVYDPLPVDLLSFFGKCNGSNVSLFWSTATEINNDYFIVEASHNALDYVPVARLSGAGNSSVVNKYNLDYENKDRYTYFRLTQYDFDGENKIYAPININCKDDLGEIMIFPNPTNSHLNILFAEANDEAATIALYDAYSRLIKHEKIELNSSNIHHVIDMSDLSNGIYILKLQSTHNEKTFRVVKQ